MGFTRTVIIALALTMSAPVFAQTTKVAQDFSPAPGRQDFGRTKVLRYLAKDLRVLDAVKRRYQKAYATQPDGATALAWAVHLGQRFMAEALLETGA